MMFAIRGSVIHTPSETLDHETGLKILDDAIIVIANDGIILEVADLSEEVDLGRGYAILDKYGLDQKNVLNLRKTDVLIPGFIDVHLHAPQYSYTGTATDKPLMEWLNHYTFPAEQAHANNDAWSEDVYTRLVKMLIANGTTTAVYFATIHPRPTMLLADICASLGQRALIGKVNMDQNSPENYTETIEESIAGTEEVISHIRSKGLGDLLLPVITPRFVPTCSNGTATFSFHSQSPSAVAQISFPTSPLLTSPVSLAPSVAKSHHSR
jgi:guanine deaminase